MGHNSRKGDISDNKKMQISYFSMRNPYMKFQNHSMHGSKDMVCIKKRDGRTDGHMDGQPKTNIPPGSAVAQW